MKALTKLVELGGDPIRPIPTEMAEIDRRFSVAVTAKLHTLLRRKNGFYAFEGALHVFSDFGEGEERGLVDWNSEELWRREYDGMADGALFFAEDVFGTQFCVYKEAIAAFDPETGAFEKMASGVEEWAEMILDNYHLWTGYTLAHEWQVEHGPILLGRRLVPVTPFVLGGDYSVGNVRAIEAVKGMKYRASVALQIRDLPDGAPINLRVIE